MSLAGDFVGDLKYAVRLQRRSPGFTFVLLSTIAIAIGATGMISEATRQPAFRMTLLLAFGVISLLLAAIGTYAVVSQTVTQGVRDIAIRLALGAEPASLVGMIVRRAVIAAVAGVLIGASVALLVGNAIEAALCPFFFRVLSLSP